MLFIIGTLVVIGSVIGGYAMPGGHLGVLWQPFEFLIIFGAAAGAFTIDTLVLVQITGGSAQMFGVPVYANNAAAIAGGLTYGQFYRTGGDPDPVCVVH